MSSKKYPDPAYDQQGRQVRVISEEHDGFCVRTIVEDEQIYDACYTEPRIIQRVYSKAELLEYLDGTVRHYEDQVTRLQLRHQDLQEQITESGRKLTEITAQLGQRALQIQSKLGRLYDFLDDKITHFVLCNYCEVEVKTKDDALKTSNVNELRLLTLYGDTKGELNWKINRHKDGSGHDDTCFPCCSLEEAIEVATARLKILSAATIAKPDSYAADKIYRAAKALGIEIPQEIVQMDREYKLAAAEKGVSAAQADLEAKQRILAAEQQKLAALS